MTRRSIIFFLCVTCATFLFLPAFAVGGWRTVKDRGDVKAYEREIPGTELREFMGITTIDARIEVVGEVIRDIASYPEWMAKCVRTKILKKIDRNTMVLYYVQSSPWPVNNRDIIIRNRTVFDFNKARAVIKFKAVKENLVPLQEKMVRITNLKGEFILEYLGRDKTKVTFTQLADPGGTVSKSVAYMVIKTGPYDSLINLKKMVKKKKYIDAAKGSPEERIIEQKQKSESYVKQIIGRHLSIFLRNKGLLNNILNSDQTIAKSIMKNNYSYASVHAGIKKILFKYMDETIQDEKVRTMLKNDNALIKEITDLIKFYHGERIRTIDDIAISYKRKYASP